MASVWLNGQFVDDAEAAIPLNDTGLLHAAGVFTTLRAANGKPFRLTQHLARLRASCDALAIPLLPDDTVITAALTELLNRNDLRDARVRITATRGTSVNDPVRGLRIEPNVFATAAAFEPYPAEFYERGMTVVLLDDQKFNPYDVQSGHKTLNYLSRFTALREASKRGAAEAIWFNVHNYVHSGCISNVFAVKDGVILTPATNDDLANAETRAAVPYPKSGVLPGVARAAAIELAQSAGFGVRRVAFTVNHLLEADEMFLTNSLMQVMPVGRVERHAVGGDRVGPITRQLGDLYRRAVEQECGT